MDGAKKAMSGPNGGCTRRNTLGEVGASPSTVAWEHFVAGDDGADAIRPVILASWLRCRDEYKVDPWRQQAPAASDEESPHTLGDDVVLAALGGIAKSLEATAEEWGGLAAVADGRGRVLAAWGDHGALTVAGERNLAPWSTWAEHETGTNGLGTALEERTATLVTQSEHWCAGFHDWTCAGIAIRDPITGHPLGVLDISVHDKPVPQSVLGRLREVVAPIEAELQSQANRALSRLLAEFTMRETAAHGFLVAADCGGRLVAANDEGRRLLGLPRTALDAPNSLRRVEPESHELKQLLLQAVERAHAEKQWIGSGQVSLPTAETKLEVTFSPVCSDEHLVGILMMSSSSAHGEGLTPTASPPPSGVTRVLGVRARRLVLLSPEEIRFAEADGNTVWMTTDQGRLRAFARGMRPLEEKVSGLGYVRVNRNFLVNLNRVREIAPGSKGGLALIMDGPQEEEVVPVSRRHAAEVRRLLGL
jgi:sigma-54 dependent transcriptional regulator, acetoin dehydrogenase operon transcriptional activator AcoR